MFITLGILLAAANKPDAPMPSMLVMKNLFTLVPTHQKWRSASTARNTATSFEDPPITFFAWKGHIFPRTSEYEIQNDRDQSSEDQRNEVSSTFQPSNPISKPAEDADARDDAMDAQVMSFIWFKPRATFAKYALNADETKYAR